MNTTELVAAVRLSAFIGDSDPEYTDAVVRGLATNELGLTVSEYIVRARQGYWRQKATLSLAAGTSAYRLPSRALGNAVELIEVPFGSGFQKLHWVDPRDVGRFEGLTGWPAYYTIDGDTLHVYPTPSTAITARWVYMLRPSTLVQAQTAGAITTVTPASYQFTTAAIPVDRVTTAAIASGASVDVIHPAGSFELGIVGQAATQSGAGPYTWTLPTGTDMSRVAVGDYVRAAEQTDWPMLPVEYHQSLADLTAAVVLIQKGATGKAQALAGKASAAFEKMRTLMEPRVKWDPAALRRRNSNFYRGPWPRFPIAGS